MNAAAAVGLEWRQLCVTSRTTLDKRIANSEVADRANARFRFQLFNKRKILILHRYHSASNYNL